VAEARSAGQVATSRDLSSGFVLAAACVAFMAGGKAVLGGLVVAMRESVGRAGGGFSAGSAMGAAAVALLSALALPLAVVTVAAIAVGLAQTRGLLGARPFRPDARRIAVSWRQVFAADKLGRAVRDMGTIGVIAAVAVLSVASSASAIVGMVGTNASRTVEAMFVLAKHLGLALACAMLGIGAADYLWQRHRHQKALRMTYAEVKREHRETEGDPVFKSERQRIHLELSQAYAFAELAEADLVLADPGRATIALRYATAIAEAPLVMFKGLGDVAARALAIASEARVPVMVDAALVAQLAAIQEGDEIPEALYEHVARHLADARAQLGDGANPSGGGDTYSSQKG